MNTEPVDVLLDKLRHGDHLAAEQAFLAYEPQLRLIVRRQLSRRLRAKFDSLDVLQSAWVHVLRGYRQSGCCSESPVHLRNFLVRVVRNCLNDRLRHFRKAMERERQLDGPELEGWSTERLPRPSEVAQANELWDNILAICPPAYHELLRLKRQGLPLADIAAQTGLHQDSVRRIIRKLARQMAIRHAVPTS